MYRVAFESARLMGRGLRALGFALAALALAGCEGGTEPSMGQVDIVLGLQSSGLASAATGASALGSQGGVPLELVQSITLSITTLEIHRVSSPDEETASEGSGQGTAGDGAGSEGVESEDDAGDRPWIRVELTEAATVDLMGLVGASAPAIATGEVPSGTYNQVRLFIGEATISFTDPVKVGNATYDADVEYELRIPSAGQSGLKVQTGFFDIGSGEVETVGLLVDLTDSVKNIVATGAGTVQMTPVIVGVVGASQV